MLEVEQRLLPSRALRCATTLLLATATVSSASAQNPTTILLSNIPGYPESAVPGEPGASFPTGDSPNIFRRVIGTAEGNWGIFTSIRTAAGKSEIMMVVNGEKFARSGEPAPWAGQNQQIDGFTQSIDVRSDGVSITPVRTTDGVTDTWHLVEKSGSALTPVVSQGDPVPQIPGAIHGRFFRPKYLTNGDLSFMTANMTGAVTSDTDAAALIGPNVLFQTGVDAPTGQLSTSGEAYDFIDSTTFTVTRDGLNWLMSGELTGSFSTSNVVVHNGQVVVQAQAIIPGTGFAQPVEVGSIFHAVLDSGGNWMARGINGGAGRGWAVRNGAVLGARNLPIIPGASETWQNREGNFPFTMLAGNVHGDYVVGGFTNGSLARDYVVVLNGHTEIFRQGDPIDLDGNGVFDDDAFLKNVINDSAHLTDDKELFLSVTVQDQAGVGYGTVVMSFDLSGNIGAPYCAAAPNSTGEISVLFGQGSASVADNALTLTAANLPASVLGYFVASETQGFLANPGGSSGNLCLAGSIGRFLMPGQVLNSGATGMFSLAIDVNGIAQPGGLIMAAPGETWNFQAWHRDTGTTATSNFTPGIAVTFE